AYELAAGRHVPHPRRLVPGGGDDAGLVRAEGGAPDRAVVGEAGELAACRRVPHPRRIVIGGGDDARSVPAEGGTLDPLVVGVEAGKLVAGRHLPEPRWAV